MPAGTSWPSYVGACIGAMLSMFAGAQVVHTFYKPLENFDSKVEFEKKKLADMEKTSKDSGNR